MNENKDYEFVGNLAETPEFQYTEKGFCKGRLLVREIKAFNKKAVDIPFELFGKPAEYASEKKLKEGDRVEITFELDAFKGYAKIKAYKVKVLSAGLPAQEDYRPPQSSLMEGPMPSSDDDIPF